MQWKQLWIQMFRSFYCLGKQLQTCSHQTMNMLFCSGVYVQNQISAACLSSVPSDSEDFPANEFLSSGFALGWQMVSWKYTLRSWILKNKQTNPTKTPKQNRPQKNNNKKTNPAQSAAQKCVGKYQSRILNTFWKLLKSVVLHLNTWIEVLHFLYIHPFIYIYIFFSSWKFGNGYAF